jgi:hypothetical protein
LSLYSHAASSLFNTSRRIPHLGLWVLLIALPLAVVVIGSASLIREWLRNPELRDSTLRVIGSVRSQVPTIMIAAATMMAGGALAIVSLHVLSD